VVDDFLPPPDKLIAREEQVKVTISLSRRSIAFFKSEGRRRRIPYQKMIRRVIDLYPEDTRRQSKALVTGYL
jgi:hypothetical protein